MTSPACQWVQGILTAYLDGELKPSTAAAVRRHLEHCEACRARAELLQETWDLLDAPTPAVPAGFTSRMMGKIVEEQALERLEARLRPHRLRRRIFASAAAIAAGLLFGLALRTWAVRLPDPGSPVEREVSACLTFVEDLDVFDDQGLDLVEVVEAWDRLEAEGRPEEGES
jgi:anti-sigma factor RsiW